MLLELEGVCKSYERPGGELKVALEDVSLSVARGQMVGVFGTSGSGKSTLLRVAAGSQRPDRGCVRYDGERLDQVSAAELLALRRNSIACVWAGQPWQENLNVLTHVALPLMVDSMAKRKARGRAREALLVCEVEQCAEMRMEELSDGERQRVEIARALVIEPCLLLADCPAVSLSLRERESVMELLASLASEANVAVVVTGGDAEELMHAEAIHFLAGGTLMMPEPMGGVGRLYEFPSARLPRAADA
jgi:putative ABC transport system ATP-binding protein